MPLPFTPFSALTSKIFGGLAITALTFAAVQTVRIEGLKVWPLDIEGYAAENVRIAANLKAVLNAQLQAKAAQEAADLANFTEEVADAETVEKASADNEAIRQSAVDAYVRANPVRLCRKEAAGGSRSRAGIASVPGDPGQPAPTPEGPPDLVAITRADLDYFTTVDVQNTGWLEFAEGKLRAGKAVRLSDIKPEFGN